LFLEIHNIMILIFINTRLACSESEPAEMSLTFTPDGSTTKSSSFWNKSSFSNLNFHNASMKTNVERKFGIRSTYELTRKHKLFHIFFPLN